MKSFVAALVGPLILLGCRSGDPFALNRKDLGMDSSATYHQIVTIGNTKLPVDVEQTNEHGIATIRIKSHGEELEEEQYKVADDELDLIRASDAIFQPVLPLLKLPTSNGQPSSWKGTITEGSTTRSATAVISSLFTSLKSSYGQISADKVTVDLSVDSGSVSPAQRRLEFWFTSSGLTKRAFGAGTIRSSPEIAN